MNKYMKLVEQSLAQSHRHNQEQMALLEVIKENITLQISALQNDLVNIDTKIEQQKQRDIKYQNITNTTNGENSIINNQGNAITSSQQPMQIEKVENLNFGKDSLC